MDPQLTPFEHFAVKETAVQANVVKSPRDEGFVEQIISGYGLSEDDAKDLMEYVKYEGFRIMQERFNRLLTFLYECKVPKLVVFSVLVTNGDKNMVQIAKQCGVSKQAVHKAFRAMEPNMKKYGNCFERRRNFRNKDI